MRIDRLRMENFKGFERREIALHPEFNLVVGENGSGKTSVLDALAVAAGSWFLGLLSGHDSRHIRQDEVRLCGFYDDESMRWESQYPCVIHAEGRLPPSSSGQAALFETWKRSLTGPKSRTTYADAMAIRRVAEEATLAVAGNEKNLLPLISYYGTGRLWVTPRELVRSKGQGTKKTLQRLSRLDGYRHSIDPRLSVVELITWIAQQSWVAFQAGNKETKALSTVREALVRNVVGAENIYFDAKYGGVIVDFNDGQRQPFSNLSDGQRCMLAMVGDIAQKAATLNPHLGGDILTKTPGIVLIDELDLHLHPKWQRHVIEDLRTTFPSIQFVCTTHSPFLIQSLRSGEELVMLDGQPTAQLANLSIEAIAHGIQGVDRTDVGERYETMRETARNYLQTLEEAAEAPAARLAEYKTRLANSIARYADNPAFQAVLEFERAVKLGE